MSYRKGMPHGDYFRAHCERVKNHDVKSRGDMSLMVEALVWLGSEIEFLYNHPPNTMVLNRVVDAIGEIEQQVEELEKRQIRQDALLRTILSILESHPHEPRLVGLKLVVTNSGENEMNKIITVVPLWSDGTEGGTHPLPANWDISENEPSGDAQITQDSGTQFTVVPGTIDSEIDVAAGGFSASTMIAAAVAPVTLVGIRLDVTDAG